MDPATMVLVATATKGVTDIMASRQKAANLETQAEMAKYSASQARQEGEERRQAARMQAQDIRGQGENLLGEQKVQFAKAGMLGGFGTPGRVSEYTRQHVARQAAIVNRQGVNDWQYGQDMGNYYTAAAKSYRKGAKRARRAGMWNLGTTLATGWGKFSSLT